MRDKGMRPVTSHGGDLVLDSEDHAVLERWVRARTTPQRTVLRSRIVLMLAGGLSGREVARRLGVSRHTVDLWRVRFIREGCEALTRDRPGRGRKRANSRRDTGFSKSGESSSREGDTN